MAIENFALGLQGVMRSMGFAVRQLVQFQLFQGFLVGFILSTLLHTFIIREDFRKLPKYLTGDPSDHFVQEAERSEDGEYKTSYLQFKRLVYRTRLAFYLGTFSFLIIVIASLIFYS